MADVSRESPPPLKSQLPPGALGESFDQWGNAASLFSQEPKALFVVADSKVLRLHPQLKPALKRHTVVALPATENNKSLAAVERLAVVAQKLPRNATVVALGGGTIGDLTTVFAHLHKRGVRLIQVPTTLLAAVDSSVGGKGAVNVKQLKNALGVFHQPDVSWLCPELWTTLSKTQMDEGQVEAWKMAATLDAHTFLRWSAKRLAAEQLIREARILKHDVCRIDPYERKGVRLALNFGHSFGHAIESTSAFRVSHGEAVALGMVCALDIGCALKLTPVAVREQVLNCLPGAATLRERLARAMKQTTPQSLGKLLSADKKNDAPGQLKMVLLSALGQWAAVEVSLNTWTPLLSAWKKGVVS